MQNFIKISIVLSILIIVFSSCERMFDNPYDAKSNKDAWKPDSLDFYVLSPTQCKLMWQQTEDRIDGFKIDKFSNGTWQEEYAIVSKDSLQWIDTNFVYSPTNTVKYKLYAYANANISGKSETTIEIDLPIVETIAASSITPTTATSGGNITSDGKTTLTARGVCWSTSQNPTIENLHTTDGSGIGSYSSVLTELAAGTTYYVRAYATNCVGTSYGIQVSVLTINIPIVTTTTPNSITTTTALSGGNVLLDGGATIIARGLCWSTSQNPFVTGNHTTDGTGTGSFTSSITELTAGTTFYARAYATTFAGTTYGNQVSFTTKITSIGSTYTGGIVFYIDETGQHGLVCAPNDQGTVAEWGCYGLAILGTSTAINTGATNTNFIVAGCSTAEIAARLCFNLTINTFSDWFLPSKDELNLMYVNLKTQGLGGFTNDFYWSSSELQGYENYNAWMQDFRDGRQWDYKKDYTIYVRAVRSF
jgi:hypothetical protein